MRARIKNQRSSVSVGEFRSRNGDTLNDLNHSVNELQKLLDEKRRALRLEEMRLVPMRKIVDEIESRLVNVRTRLNVWWGEYEGRR